MPTETRSITTFEAIAELTAKTDSIQKVVQGHDAKLDTMLAMLKELQGAVKELSLVFAKSEKQATITPPQTPNPIPQDQAYSDPSSDLIFDCLIEEESVQVADFDEEIFVSAVVILQDKTEVIPSRYIDPFFNDVVVDEGSVKSEFVASFFVVDGDISFCTSTVCQNVYEIFPLDIVLYPLIETWDKLWKQVIVIWLEKPPPFPPDLPRSIILSDDASCLIESEMMHSWVRARLSFLVRAVNQKVGAVSTGYPIVRFRYLVRLLATFRNKVFSQGSITYIIIVICCLVPPFVNIKICVVPAAEIGKMKIDIEQFMIIVVACHVVHLRGQFLYKAIQTFVLKLMCQAIYYLDTLQLRIKYLVDYVIWRCTMYRLLALSSIQPNVLRIQTTKICECICGVGGIYLDPLLVSRVRCCGVLYNPVIMLRLTSSHVFLMHRCYKAYIHQPHVGASLVLVIFIRAKVNILIETAWLILTWFLPFVHRMNKLLVEDMDYDITIWTWTSTSYYVHGMGNKLLVLATQRIKLVMAPMTSQDLAHLFFNIGWYDYLHTRTVVYAPCEVGMISTILSLIKIMEPSSFIFKPTRFKKLEISMTTLLQVLNMLDLTTLMLNMTIQVMIFSSVIYNHPRIAMFSRLTVKFSSIGWDSEVGQNSKNSTFLSCIFPLKIGQIFLKSFILWKLAHPEFLEGFHIRSIGFIGEYSLQNSLEGHQFIQLPLLIKGHAPEVLFFLKRLQLHSLVTAEEDVAFFRIGALSQPVGVLIRVEFVHLMLDKILLSVVLIMNKQTINDQSEAKFDKQWNVRKFYTLTSRLNKLPWIDSDNILRIMLQSSMLCAFGGSQHIGQEHPDQRARPFCGAVVSSQFSHLNMGLRRHSSVHFKCLPFPGDNIPTNEVVLKQEEVLGSWVYSNAKKLHLIYHMAKMNTFVSKDQGYLYLYMLRLFTGTKQVHHNIHAPEIGHSSRFKCVAPLHDQASQYAITLKMFMMIRISRKKKWYQNVEGLSSAELVMLLDHILAFLMFSVPRPPEARP